MKVNYYNPVKEKQDYPIKWDYNEIEVPGMNEISGTESTASNVIRKDRERHSL